jgi:hypothetical protein
MVVRIRETPELELPNLKMRKQWGVRRANWPGDNEKKPRRGSETPKPDMDLIRLRLKKAEEQHAENIKTGKIPERKHND